MGKLQIAFAGNPRRRKKHRAKKNPVSFTARKGKKVVGKGTFLTPDELAHKKRKTEGLQKRLFNSPLGQKGSGAFRKKMKVRKATLAATKNLHKWQNRTRKSLEALQRAKQDGASISLRSTGAAKKTVASTSIAKKIKKSKNQQLSFFDKKETTVAKRKKHRKHKAKAHKKAGRVRRRRASVRSVATRSKFAKGTVFKFKASRRYRHRKVSIFGKIKVNPSIDAGLKKYLNISGKQLVAIAGGGALVPIVNSLVYKLADKFGQRAAVDKVNSILGPAAAGAVFPMIGGVLLNVIAESGYIKSSETKDSLKLVGEGLATAGIVSIMASLSQEYAVPAMNGVLFTPRMGNTPPQMGRMGIYPRLSGGNTPAQMGIYPQLNGQHSTPPQMGDVRFTPKKLNGINVTPNAGDVGPGYTELHKQRRADFGRVERTQQADFGGADYGSEVVGVMS